MKQLDRSDNIILLIRRTGLLLETLNDAGMNALPSLARLEEELRLVREELPAALTETEPILRRVARGFEQQVVDHGLVLIGDIGDPSGQREYHVIVRHRQQLGLALGQPSPGAATPWHFGQCRLRQEL